MWHHRGSATLELCLQIILKKYRGELWFQQETILQFWEMGDHGKSDFAHLWCQVWFIAHQIGLPCMLSTPHQAMKYLENQGGWNVMRGLVMQKLHTVYTHGTWFKCHFEKENQISNLHQVYMWIKRLFQRGIHFVKGQPALSHEWIWYISVSLWDEMGTSADQTKQDWMKLLLLDEFDTNHKFLLRKVTKPSKLFGRNNGYLILQNGSSLWRHPIKQGAQNICDTESCGGSSADDRTMKCPKFVVSRKETSRVQAQVMKKWMVRLKMAKRANADLLRLRNSYIQTFLFLIIL